jgi:hypothetical protein
MVEWSLGVVIFQNCVRRPRAHLTQQFQRSFLSDFLSNFLFLVMVDILAGGRGRWTEF